MKLAFFSISFSDLKRNKKRTFLSVLAIAIGVFSLIVLTSISLGINKDILSKLKGFGADMIIVIPVKVENAAVASNSAGFMAHNERFYEKDANKIKSIKGVKLTSYVLQGRASLTYRNETKSVNIYAVQPSAYLVFSKDLSIAKGRWINKNSYEAVLGAKVSDNFENPLDVGKNVIIGNKTYRIVGILEETGNSLSQLDDVVLIPYFAGRELYSTRFAEDEISAILIQIAEGYEVKKVAKEVESYLMKIKKISKEEDKFFSLITKDFIENSISQITSLLDSFFVSISMISLFVGLIGVGNSVYMSIIEKTREIGTLRAVGMRKKDVMSVYLIEGAILGGIGFTIGLLFALIVVFVGSSLIPMELNFAN